MSKITPEARARMVPHSLQDQLAHAKARIAMLEQDVSIARTEKLLLQRRLTAAGQGVPERYARNLPEWSDVDFALREDRGGQ